MNQNDKLLKVALKIVKDSLDSIRSFLLSGEPQKISKIKDDKVTRFVDTIAEKICLKVLKKTKVSFMLISEESGIKTYGQNPKITVILDPLDGTDCAIRGIPLCSVALSIHDYKSMETLAAAIGHPFTGKIFYATKDKAFCNGEKIRPSLVKAIEKAFIVTYAAKPDRLVSLVKRKELIKKVGLLLNYGGPFNIAQVGSGEVDAFIEYEKGFKCIELAAGAHIAKVAGAIVTDIHGNEIKIHPDLQHRTTLIAACTLELHSKLKRILNNGD